MPVPITKADLVDRIGAGEVDRLSGGDDTVVTRIIAMAWDSMRSAGLNVFTPSSWDAMTAETLPGEARRHGVSDAVDLLYGGNAGAREDIGKKAEEARQWRSWLAADKVRCFDAVLERNDNREDGAGVTYKASERKFDRSTNDYFGVPRR